MTKKTKQEIKAQNDELNSFEPITARKGMMTEKDKDGLLVFLYNWINIHNLKQHQYTAEVVAKIQATFNCDLDDYIRTVQHFEARGYVDYDHDGELYVTEPGFRRVKDIVELHGDIPITFHKI